MAVQILQGKLRLVYPPTVAEQDAKPLWPYPQGT